MAAGAACDRPRARGRTAADEPLGLAVPRRARPRAGGDVRHARERQLVLRRVLQRDRRPGRADLRRPLARARRGGQRARTRARLRGGAAGGRHRTGRRGRPAAPRRAPPRASARARVGSRGSDRAHRRGRRAARAGRAAHRAAARRARADAARSRARPARLRREERLRSGRRGRFRRDRLGTDQRPRRRGPGRRACPLRLDAVALLLRGDASRRATAGREPRHRLPRAADRRDRAGLRRRARGELRRTRARSRRGEPAGTDSRSAADGALEQVRLARRGDREQVGALGGLRDALRRHGRRLRAAQGCLQDRRLPARAAPERACRHAS